MTPIYARHEMEVAIIRPCLVYLSPAVLLIAFHSGTLVFHPLIYLFPVKTPLGRNFGCGNIPILRHSVQFAVTKLQIVGQLRQCEPSVHRHHHFSTEGTNVGKKTLRRGLFSTNEYQRISANINVYQ